MATLGGDLVSRSVGPTTQSGGLDSATPSSVTPDAQTACVEAAHDWNDHQPDRAWIEYGFRWPPFSVRRPRCLACSRAWPCHEALAAHEHLTGCDKHGQPRHVTSDDR
jgi:hypothetical protein